MEIDYTYVLTALITSPVFVFYIKMILKKLKVTEEQADIIINYGQTTIDTMGALAPKNENIKKADVVYRKLREVWEDPDAPTVDMDKILKG